MDIEGAEEMALNGAGSVLAGKDAPVILMTAHSEQLRINCKLILEAAGYAVDDIAGNMLATKRQ